MRQGFTRNFCRGAVFARACASATAVVVGVAAGPGLAQIAPLSEGAQPAEAHTLAPPTGEVLLRIRGQIRVTNVGGDAHFDRAMLSQFPERHLTTHTSVTDGPQRFRGILLRDVLDRVGAHGTVIAASALNDYLIDIPITDASKFDVILATHMNGVALTPRDKGPLWIVYPRDDWAVLQDVRYDYRWVWQLTDLEIK